MARDTPQETLTGVEKSTQLQQLTEALEKANTLFTSPKQYAKFAIENPEMTARCIAAAKALTPSLRQIITFG